jgi:hypothetical protein
MRKVGQPFFIRHPKAMTNVNRTNHVNITKGEADVTVELAVADDQVVMEVVLPVHRLPDPPFP